MFPKVEFTSIDQFLSHYHFTLTICCRTDLEELTIVKTMQQYLIHLIEDRETFIFTDSPFFYCCVLVAFSSNDKREQFTRLYNKNIPGNIPIITGTKS